MDLSIIVFTMKGCPFCQDFKEMLKEAQIEFIERDIDEHHEEYDLFSSINKNDMIPALLIIESNGDKHEPYQYVKSQKSNLNIKISLDLSF